MNKIICTVFAAALSLSAYSANAATTSSNNDASNLGTQDTPQQVEQSKAAAHKTSKKPMSHKNRMDRCHAGMKTMDTNGDGMISKDEYMAYHEQQFSKMKQTDGMVNIKDMGAAMHNCTNNNSLNNKPIGTTTGKSHNGSTDDTKVGPINGTHTGTN